MTTISTLHTMTFGEAKSILAGIGYRPDWTVPELLAATPADMRNNVVHALRITALAYEAEAEALRTEVRRRVALRAVPAP